MGNPNSELDQRWEVLAATRSFGVDRSTLEKLNRTKAAVQWPKAGTYQASLEVFHQLHCLNYIRMYTHLGYYRTRNQVMLIETEEEHFDHKEHCIEPLRQAIMCHADLNVYTYHWSSRFDNHVAELRSRHRCIDWDIFYDWADKHQVREAKPKKHPGLELWED